MTTDEKGTLGKPTLEEFVKDTLKKDTIALLVAIETKRENAEVKRLCQKIGWAGASLQ